jgi:hypothetical protein
MNMEATAWVGKWVKAQEGTLSLNAGRLRFANEQRCLFDSELSKLEKIVWHWYSFSGAFEVWIGDANYFVSFVPRKSRLGAWHSGLAEGHQWRAALEGRPLPQSGPLGPKIFISLLSLVQAFFYACGAILISMWVADESKALWERIGWGLLVLLLLFMILYLLWQAVTTPFRRNT